MFEVFKKSFPQYMEKWEPKLKEMISSYGLLLADNPELLQKVHASTAKTLRLREDELVDQ